MIRLDRSISLDRLVASITAIDGLGEWTANYIALRLGERDAFPVGDLGLQRALDLGTRGATATLAERWRPWRALAATHLWLAQASSHGARSHAG
jgi:3-methyladenine DNA glycosylase/8-oxoguanine DNA glycosylase